jgi:hypothetical protein
LRLQIALSKGLNRENASLPLSEDGNRSIVQNAVFSSYLDFWMMNKLSKAVILTAEGRLPIDSSKRTIKT